jgi:hypothetical protein
METPPAADDADAALGHRFAESVKTAPRTSRNA